MVMTVPMYQSQIGRIVHAPAFLRNHMVDVGFLTIFQRLVTDRAEALLALEKQAVLTLDSRGFGSALPPIVL